MEKEITYKDLYDFIKTYIKDEQELEIINKAYEFANNKHLNQKRMTGEPYIIHPINVAYILAEIYADFECICAGLLHDVLEDCDVTREEMENIFGSNITNLVEGVTKINRLSFSLESEAMTANHRKILVGMTEDVRVIIIKLADRLHNMRTLYALPEKKQKIKAKETLDILTPIAHRLGMNKIKSELEDLSFKYYKPNIYKDIEEKLNKSKLERDTIVKEMQEKISSVLNSHGLKHEIKGRAKSIYSIYKKLDKGRKYNDIYDFLALRVFVNTVEECYQALGYIHSKYRPIPKRFKDYISMPKNNMYQSLHTTVFGMDGYLFEIQIRTYEMDKIAENGIASHWSYKEHGSNVKADMQNDMEQKLQFFRTIMEMKQESLDDKEFVESVKEDAFNDLIYVFTPRGDVIELPKGATPIDFAYKVHTDIGDKMVGAIVNDTIVALDYELNDNDVVKININKNSTGPSYEWINIAKTHSAKNKIKSFYNRLDKTDNIKKGEELLQKEFKKRKKSFNEFLEEKNLKKVLESLKISNLNELYINICNNNILTSTIYDIIYSVLETKEERILKQAITNKQVVSKSNDIFVKGITNVKLNISRCCKPIPKEDIVGYITKGSGISIHRSNCPNIKNTKERIIDVYWNDIITNKYSATLLVQAEIDNNLLINIISKANSLNVSVNNINTLKKDGNFVYKITVLLESIEKLNKFMNEINNINSVLKVNRICL
ncbi:MAG: bifunctional (p)ppGpp synthetase/guanosine-3',5'-bis(diphosphate) 3'-pyrophosphohydrolase [Clostridium sp.]|nr:bifunctional (p)ppGpp synthetase/guanosine-3',5'-bis(diphosphate) 3'-pyrophosphohydrolase [Clostridium sp.]MCM1444026.1 bifunctional (p)ppGpp synthetase/guanosine-3',5'-bis(diphosphate) 3'-pyrophosphohydrolase [Candidatus Amulumruptor caecigallinarius]